MARFSQHATYGYAIADAKHVYKAAGKHWSALAAIGATDGERKRFAQTIAEAGALVTDEDDGPITLEEARQALKDQVGDYRSAAGLVVYGIDGPDSKAEKALRMKGGFPSTDLRLTAYLKGLATPMKSYAARLAARGFDRNQQSELVRAGQVFNKAFAARGQERGTARSETVTREAFFKQLRTETTYFRKLGREALRSSVGRADFDRVKLPGKPAAAPSTTTTAAPSTTTTAAPVGT